MRWQCVCKHCVCVMQFRGVIPDNAPNPGKLGEAIAENAGGPDVKGAASEVSLDLVVV